MKIGLLEVKAALRDGKFRDILPLDLQDDVVKYLSNPGCACNIPFYRKLLTKCKKELQAYYPHAEIPDETEEIEEISKLAKNNWSVINCSIFELESKLKELPPGRKHLAVARYQDQVTVIIDELDVIF